MESLSIYTSESTEDMPNHEKLNKSIFCIYLGGKHPKANIEMHDLVITSGNSIQDCFQYCRDNWFANADAKGAKKIKPHIDGYFQVDFDKNYVNTGEYKLFLMNYGGYLAGQLAETHEFVTVFAKNKGDAIKRTNKNLKLGLKLLHMDNCIELDDCVDVSAVTGLQFLNHVNTNVKVTMHQDYFSI